jgi:hypothetical protein
MHLDQSIIILWQSPFRPFLCDVTHMKKAKVP